MNVETPWPRPWSLLVVTAAVLAVAPMLLPGGEFYMDNAPHLLEVQAAALQILPQDHWFTGWIDHAEMGFAVGQINAPLAWTPLAALVWLGAPLVGSYLAAIALTNIAFSLGFLRAARHFLGNGPAALWAGLLAAVAPADLYGISGAAGGMWPFRLASGLFFWGAVAAWSLGARALWLAALLLMHTYVGVVGFGWVGVALLLALWKRNLPKALEEGVAIGLGAGLAAFFWMPTREPGLLPFVNDSLSNLLYRPWAMAAFCLGSPDMLKALIYNRPAWLGGLGSVVSSVGMVVGLAGCIGRRPVWSPSSRHLAIALAGLAAIVFVVVPTLKWIGLGPNPWRYLSFVRQGLFLFAGWGLARWVPARLGAPLAAVLVAGTVAVGWNLATCRYKPEVEETVTALEATWQDLAAAAPKGWVYHDDPAQDQASPDALYDSHIGSLLPLRHGLREVGSWYGVTPIWTYKKTTAQANKIFGESVKSIGPVVFQERLDRYGIGAVITASPATEELVARVPRLHRISNHGPFSAYLLDDPKTSLAEGPGTIKELERSRDRYRLETDQPGRVDLRIGWHPWWTATLNGTPLPLEKDPETAMLTTTLPEKGVLELRWVDQGDTGRRLSLLSLLALASLFLLRRVQPTFFQTAERPLEL